MTRDVAELVVAVLLAAFVGALIGLLIQKCNI